MKITIVQGAFLPVPPLLGGAVEKVWLELGKYFVKKGHEVTHISRQFGELPLEEYQDGVSHVRVAGYNAPKSIVLLKWLDLAYSRRVTRWLPCGDILVSNTFWLPVLIRNENFGRLYVHVARYPKRQLWFYRHADRLQTVSGAVAGAMASQVPSLSDKIKVIPNPVSLKPLKEMKIIGDAAKFNLLYVGRLHPEKGLHLIFEALSLMAALEVSKIRLTMVGPWEAAHGGGGEPYLRRLKQLSANCDCRIEWVGPVFNADELDSYYRKADLFLYPSLAEKGESPSLAEKGESFGLAPLEAMAHGCPALVSALGCFEDFIEDGKNGFVFNHRLPSPRESLAVRLKEILTQPELLATAGINAHNTAKNFSIEKVACAYLEDFQSLLSM